MKWTDFNPCFLFDVEEFDIDIKCFVSLHQAVLSVGSGWLWGGLVTLTGWWGNNEGMYGMTDIRGLAAGLSFGGVTGMIMSSWSHTWKAFGWERVRAGGMWRGLTPSGSPSFFSSSSGGPNKQSGRAEKNSFYLKSASASLLCCCLFMQLLVFSFFSATFIFLLLLNPILLLLAMI